MSAYTDQLFAKAAQVKAERETESLATAQAALDKARRRYREMPSSSRAYDIAQAKDRVQAAKARETVAPRLMCQELRQEWQASGGI